MNILMLNHEFPPVGAGAADASYNLAKELVKNGHSVDVITMRFGTLKAFENIDGINIYRTPAMRKKINRCSLFEMLTFIVGAFPKAKALCKKNRYNLIHCHFLIPAGILAFALSKSTSIPFIITCHGSDVPGHNPDKFALAHKILTPFWRFLTIRTPLITSPSISLKNLILKNSPHAKVKVIHNGINLPQEKKYDKKNSILMCGRVYKFKGFQYAIQAFNQLGNTDWQLNIIGDGSYINELHSQAASNRNIKFWGWLDKNSPQYKELFEESTIFILPSEAESFGLVLAEAMSYKNACITTNIGATVEVAGDAALFFEPRNVNQLKDQILKLINDPQLTQQLAQKGFDRSRNLFSWQKLAQEYLDCYDNVINFRNSNA